MGKRTLTFHRAESFQYNWPEGCTAATVTNQHYEDVVEDLDIAMALAVGFIPVVSLGML